MFDQFDRKILGALQAKGNATNAELADIAGISVSQAGRRKARLEQSGVIDHYQARLSPERIGLGIQAFVQVSLSAHSRDLAQSLHKFLRSQDEIVNIWTLTGRADYLLQIFCQSLGDLNRLVHDVLLTHENISHVESQIVMSQIKTRGPLPLT